MSVFEAVKQISCNDAAQHLGLKGRRTSAGQGRWCCPFHEDSHPSMACYDSTNRYYCFTCHANGDAANLFAKVRGLSQLEAARAALTEFGLEVPGGCDRPRAARPAELSRPRPVREPVVRQAVEMIRLDYHQARVAYTQAQLDALVTLMEKIHDAEGWVWSWALEKAVKLQDEVHRLGDYDEGDIAGDVRLFRKELPEGMEMFAPAKPLFRRILDDLTRLHPDTFPQLTPSEIAAALEEICPTEKGGNMSPLEKSGIPQGGCV